MCRSRSDRTFRPAAAHARFRQSMGTLSFHVPSPVLAPLWNYRGPGGSRGRGTITMDDAFFKTTMPSSHAFFTCLFHACLLHITHACSRVLRVLDPCSVDRGFHAAGKQSRQSTSTVIASHDQSSFVHRRYRHIPGSVESRFRKLVFRVHDALFVQRRARLRGKVVDGQNSGPSRAQKLMAGAARRTIRRPVLSVVASATCLSRDIEMQPENGAYCHG